MSYIMSAEQARKSSLLITFKTLAQMIWYKNGNTVKRAGCNLLYLGRCLSQQISVSLWTCLIYSPLQIHAKFLVTCDCRHKIKYFFSYLINRKLSNVLKQFTRQASQIKKIDFEIFQIINIEKFITIQIFCQRQGEQRSF